MMNSVTLSITNWEIYTESPMCPHCTISITITIVSLYQYNLSITITTQN